jgi:hypothetical protein
MVKKYEGRYRSSCKSDKRLIALHIVLKLKGMNPPARFMTKEHVSAASKGGVFVESDYWYEVDDVQATRKVAQRLREKTWFFTAAKRSHKYEVGTKIEDRDNGRASPIPSCENSTTDNEVKFAPDVSTSSTRVEESDASIASTVHPSCTHFIESETEEIKESSGEEDPGVHFGDEEDVKDKAMMLPAASLLIRAPR